MKKVRVAGVNYTITLGKDSRTLIHDKNVMPPGFVWGALHYQSTEIGIFDGPNKDVTRVSAYHEIVHAILEGYHIHQMMDEDDKHIEDSVDLMAVALHEVMNSLGFDILKAIK